MRFISLKAVGALIPLLFGASAWAQDPPEFDNDQRMVSITASIEEIPGNGSCRCYRSQDISFTIREDAERALWAGVESTPWIWTDDERGYDQRKALTDDLGMEVQPSDLYPDTRRNALPGQFAWSTGGLDIPLKGVISFDNPDPDEDLDVAAAWLRSVRGRNSSDPDAEAADRGLDLLAEGRLRVQRHETYRYWCVPPVPGQSCQGEGIEQFWYYEWGGYGTAQTHLEAVVNDFLGLIAYQDGNPIGTLLYNLLPFSDEYMNDPSHIGDSIHRYLMLEDGESAARAKLSGSIHTPCGPKSHTVQATATEKTGVDDSQSPVLNALDAAVDAMAVLDALDVALADHGGFADVLSRGGRVGQIAGDVVRGLGVGGLVLDWYLLGLDILRRATAGNYEGENSHERVELVVQKPCRRNYSCPVWPGVIDHISVEMSAEQAVVSIRHPAPTSSAQIGARYLWDYKVANCHVPGFPPPRRPITPGVPPWWDDVDPDPEDEAPPVITPSHPEVGGAVEPGLRDRDPSAHDEHEPPPADQWEQDVHPDDPSGHPHVPVDPHRRIHPHAGDPNLPPEYFEDEVPVPPQGV